MAKSKTLVKKVDSAADGALTSKVAKGSPYQLDPAQVERAAKALVAHMRKHVIEQEASESKKNLADDEDEAEAHEQPIFLSVATKKHVHNTNRLIPSKIPLPHPIIPNDVRICLFTRDPQRSYKDLVASDAFPAALRPKIHRILAVSKLRKRYKSFEQKRALFAEYDLFLVDDRVIQIVAEFLGKTFYATKHKRPVPVRLTAGAFVEKGEKKKVEGVKKDKDSEGVVGTPEGVAKEIDTALSSTYLSMSASANTTIRIGSLNMAPEQIAENTAAVVAALIPKHIEAGWRNIRGLHIKGTSTKALPIWLADELWLDDSQVLDGPVSKQIGVGGKNTKAEQKRKWEAFEDEMLDDEDLTVVRKDREEKRVRKEKKREKRDISRGKRKALKDQVVGGVSVPLVAAE